VTEAELRVLAGISAQAEVCFLDEQWEIREDGLAALLRYALGSASDNPEAGMPLAVIYELFEACLTDFRGFGLRAMDARAEMGDLTPVIHQLVSWYCARDYWPAMRLIGFIAANLDEVDGQLIRAGGRGIASLSAREVCNVALAACLDGRNEEDREAFMMDLEYEGDPESEALQQLRMFQAEQKAAREAADG
jgi:hypothetical protein